MEVNNGILLYVSCYIQDGIHSQLRIFEFEQLHQPVAFLIEFLRVVQSTTNFPVLLIAPFTRLTCPLTQLHTSLLVLFTLQ